MYKVIKTGPMGSKEEVIDQFPSFTDAQVYASMMRRRGMWLKVESTTRASGAFDQSEYETTRG